MPARPSWAQRIAARQRPGPPRRAYSRAPLVAAGAVIAAALAQPAPAQIAGSLAVQSDYRVRGDTISGNRPAAILDLSYDDPSGLYLAGSLIGALDRGDDPALLGAIGNVGYATRLGPGLSVDAGYARTQYAHYVGAAHGYAHYDELYAGVTAHGLSAHLHVSPDYLRRGVSTLYGELDGALTPIGAWRLTGHVGVLGYLAQPRALSLRTRYDWRIGIARPVGRVDLHVALTGGGPDGGCCRSHSYGRTALIGGASIAF